MPVVNTEATATFTSWTGVMPAVQIFSPSGKVTVERTARSTAATTRVVSFLPDEVGTWTAYAPATGDNAARSVAVYVTGTGSYSPPETPYGVCLTVSPVGVATTGAVNDGADFGPDTPGTTTCGIQEALNALPTYTYVDSAAATVTASRGWVQLRGGVFSVTSRIDVPRHGIIRLRGVGRSVFNPVVANMGGVYSDLGGTAIVASAATATTGVLRIQAGTNTYPSCMFDFGDMDVRIQSPAAAQTTAAPAVVDLFGMNTGAVTNLCVLELTTAGAIAGHMSILLNINSGPNCDNAIVENVYCFGGYIAFLCARAHTWVSNIFAGFTTADNGAYSRGIELDQNTHNWFGNLHTFSTTNGLVCTPYTSGSHLVIHGIHFESVSHYMLPTYGSTAGVLVLDEPIWDVAGLNPVNDMAAQLTAGASTYSLSAKTGLAVISRNENDPRSYGASAHVTVPAASMTAGTSPYTYPVQPFDCVYICTSAGGMTGLTLDGTAISTSTGVPIRVEAYHALIATWATTAPVFRCIPQ